MYVSYTGTFILCSDHSPEDSPDIPPPPGVGDGRQCALCLNYGDENTNVSNHQQKRMH